MPRVIPDRSIARTLPDNTKIRKISVDLTDEEDALIRQAAVRQGDRSKASFLRRAGLLLAKGVISGQVEPLPARNSWPSEVQTVGPTEHN